MEDEDKLSPAPKEEQEGLERAKRAAEAFRRQQRGEKEPEKKDEKPKAKAPEKEPEPKAKESDDEGEHDEKTRTKMQERIKELVEEKRATQAEIAEMKQALAELKKGAETPKEEKEIRVLKDEYLGAQSKRTELRKSLRVAIREGDDEAADQIERELDKADSVIMRLEVEYAKIQDRQTVGESEKAEEKNIREWNEGFIKATRKFPELLDEKGKLNVKSRLWKKTEELLALDASPAKFIKGIHKQINPEYDHKNGFIDAARDAREALRDEDFSQLLRGSKKKADEDGEKDQLLTGGRGPSGDEDNSKNSKIEKLKRAMYKDGANSPAGREYYAAIRKDYKYDPARR